MTSLHLGSDSLKPEEAGSGDLTLATDAAEVSWQEYWFRAGTSWFQNLEMYWQDFCAPGPLKNRRYSPEKAGRGTHGTLAARVAVGPGKSARVRFVIAWSFPNCENYWDKKAGERCQKACVPTTWRNHYATVFKDSAAAAAYSLGNWNRLHRETLAFKQALFASDLPPAALEAVSANLSILKSPTVLRLQDGTFYGWEGCHPGAGCCEGSCTHVWNYAQALAFLFPKLERSMREADYRHNLRPDGGMAFRLQLPLGSGRSRHRPCADGQFGGVMKIYRDWKISGDSEWLRSLWPAVKRSIAFAWAKTNEDQWDPEKAGVLHGRQHHTLDMELFGPNSWLTGMYLGALKAGAEMAEALGEAATAAEYRALFEKGKRWADRRLFNGEYYHQLLDLGDRAMVDRFGAAAAYWDPEHREIMFQIGEGCGVDQVLAQWHADLYGLGEVFDPKQTKRALRAIYRHNFKQPMGEHWNPCRIYCLNDEGGLVICAWPEGKRKPLTPAPYSQETFHGCEYAAAAHMIQRGLVREGMKVVEAVRARYDGERRNPWNEFECGSNYARSLASYALLNAFSGFRFDMAKGLIGFAPVRTKEGHFQCFWSLDSAWGVFSLAPGRVTVEVKAGSLSIKTLELPFLRGKRVRSVSLGGRQVAFEQREGRLELRRRARAAPGSALVVRLSREKR